MPGAIATKPLDVVATKTGPAASMNSATSAATEAKGACPTLPVLLGKVSPSSAHKEPSWVQTPDLERNRPWQSLCREASSQQPARELHLPFVGDVEDLCSMLHRGISEAAGNPSVFIVSMSQETQFFATAAAHLRAFRRLARLSPWPIACKIRAPALKPMDVIVALTCDLVFAERKEMQVTADAQDELMKMARSHWRFFTGVPAPEGPNPWPLEGLALDAARSPSGLLGAFVPHYRMAMRNVGMAASISGRKALGHARSTDATGSSVERLKGAFTYILGPKVACLFAAWDAAQARSGQAATAIPEAARERLAQLEREEGVDAAAAWQQRQIERSVVCERVSVSEARVILTSDVLLAHKEFVAQQCSTILSQKAIKTIYVLLQDGTFADSQSIFPAGVHSHVDLYKWHRRWEQFLTKLRVRRVVATMAGESVCPPLMELFFSSDVRLWASRSARVSWCKPPFAYTPGPEAAQGGLRELPVALLRQLLLDGIPVAVAERWGLIRVQSDARTQMTDGDMEDIQHSKGEGGEQEYQESQPLDDQPHVWRVRSMVDSSEVAPTGCDNGALLTATVALSSTPAARRRRSAARKPTLGGIRSMPTRAWEWGAGQLRLPHAGWRPSCEKGSCSMIGYGLGTPGEEHRHRQASIASLMGVPKSHPHYSVLTAPHIKTRYLAEMERDLADPAAVDLKRLHEKHLFWSRKMLHDAIAAALADAGISGADVGHVSVTSSTGYLLPGLSAYIVQDKRLNIPQSVSRFDIVGMGCHAGLNSLKSAAAWAMANPGCYALACGVEVESAQYVWGEASRKNLNNIVCNSLFGDGSFACVLCSAPEGKGSPPPAYLDAPARWWTALCDTNALSDMIYQVEPAEGKYRFDLSELAPYHVSQGLFTMMHLALYADIPVHYADHVVSHTGGQTILDNVTTALGLEGRPEDTLPYTVGALREYGNQSSCSFMFAFDKLVKSGKVRPMDLGLFVTMGPGAGLEMALWTAGDRFEA